MAHIPRCCGATARIQLLAWEPPCASSTALKRQKKKKKKKKEFWSLERNLEIKIFLQRGKASTKMGYGCLVSHRLLKALEVEFWSPISFFRMVNDQRTRGQGCCGLGKMR